MKKPRDKRGFPRNGTLPVRGSLPIAISALVALSHPFTAGAETTSTNDVATTGKEPTTQTADLTEIPFSDLLNIIVTSPSRTEQPLSKSAAAIFVITQEDIRRSGATSIPEALRMSPGLNVARVDSHQWAVSSRGFNDTFANKLLVMIDGRTVYTPLFSGVFWDVQDTVLEDIERIEIIRGPGASLWGANAVNGVINIITKSAKDTQGFLLSGGGGTEERAFSSFRYGGKVNDETSFRVYGKYFDRDDTQSLTGGDANDSWQMGRGGFRLDWQPTDPNLFTLQGDAYAGKLDQTFTRLSPTPGATGFYQYYPSPTQFDVNGGNVLGRWSHTFSEESSVSLQTYYDRTVRDAVIFKEIRDTFDADFQHRFSLCERNDIVWGGSYRMSGDDVGNSFDVSLNPQKRTTQLFSAFVQDEITLIDKRLFFTMGSKVEHNDFTGVEVQPSARVLWTPEAKHSVWASVSRAVRTPSRAEDDVRLNSQPGPAPGSLVSIFGSRAFESEEVLAYELGYRVQPFEPLSFDVATFYNDYDNLRGTSAGAPFVEFAPGPRLVIPLTVDNNLTGETYGAELAANWQAIDWWRLSGSYTFLQMDIRSSSPADPTSVRSLEGTSPHHQFSIGSKMDLPWHLEFDSTIRFVDGLPAQNVESYVSLDLRLGWRPTKNLEMSLVGQNLLSSHHQEFRPTTIVSEQIEVERGVYGKITLRF